MLEARPLTAAKRDEIIVCRVPAEGQWGTDSDPFSRVQLSAVTAEGLPCEKLVKAHFATEGKLGTLHGGLVCGESFRKPMSGEDIQSLPLAHVQSQLVEVAKNLGFATQCCAIRG